MGEERFEPLKSPVSGSLIRDLPLIARRARALLAGKSVSEIGEAQWQIEEARRVAFEHELEAAVDLEKARLRQRALYEGDEDAARFFEIIVDGRGEVHCRFYEGMQEEFEYMPELDDRTRLESALDFINWGLPLDGSTLEDWTGSDFLAAHSMTLVEEVEGTLTRIAEPDDEDLKILQLTTDLDRAAEARAGARRPHMPSFFEIEVRDAFTLAMEALDSVGKAEFRRAESAAQDVRRQLAGQVSSAKEEATAEREKRRLAALNALKQRHSRNRELREEVLREWDADRTRFPSAERAGEHFADWLEVRGFAFQQRTVRDWIRAHAKKQGIVFR